MPVPEILAVSLGPAIAKSILRLWLKKQSKTRSSSAQELQDNYDRYGKPTAYRLPEPLVAAVAAIAAQEGVDKADLVRSVLERFVEEFRAGRWELDKTPERYRVR